MYCVRLVTSFFALASLAFVGIAAANAQGQSAFMQVIGKTSQPIGHHELCARMPSECRERTPGSQPVRLTPVLWNQLIAINDNVNTAIEPDTDKDIYGREEYWNYPDASGKGDCEDYVLLKRRMLMQAGWPREALLVTVVRERNGDGHAVLTVKTDKGEFILDNQYPDILLWSDTSYRFVKRQSQHDQNVWISLGDPRPTISTATSR